MTAPLILVHARREPVGDAGVEERGATPATDPLARYAAVVTRPYRSA